MAWHRIPQLLDRLESRIALLSLVWKGATVVVAGAATGWIAYITDWIAAYGPIGWWSAALLGTLVASLIMWIFAAIRYAWIHATAKDRWSKVVDKVNPLSHKFDSQRILLSDLAHPISGKIKNKSFIDCELIGSVNIGMSGECRFTEVEFSNCDLIVALPDSSFYNAIDVVDSKFYRGSIWKCTIIILPEMVSVFLEMNARFVTLTGYKYIDVLYLESVGVIPSQETSSS